MDSFEDTAKQLDLESVKSAEELNEKIKEQFGISLDDMILHLAEEVKNNPNKVAATFINVAPMGDYSKLLESPEEIAKFFSEEGYKPEFWIPETILSTESGFIEFSFTNTSVDDGTTCKGYVVISSNGKIKHAFAQGEE